MGLSGYKVRTSITVSDLARAAQFYEGKLGLSALETRPDESRIYARGGDTSLHAYASPENAGGATATLATWYVGDLPSLKADEKGIHELDDGRVAWFKDPDGNTFAVEE